MKFPTLATLLCAAALPASGAEAERSAKPGPPRGKPVAGPAAQPVSGTAGEKIAGSTAAATATRPNSPKTPPAGASTRTTGGPASASNKPQPAAKPVPPPVYQTPDHPEKDYLSVAELEGEGEPPDLSEVREATRISDEIIRGKKAAEKNPAVISGSSGLMELEDKRLGAVVGLPLAPDGDRVKRSEHPHLRPVDPKAVRKQLETRPKTVVRPPLPPRQIKVEKEGEEDAVGQFTPGRVYFPSRNAVVVVEDERARELPYVEVPVLFVSGTSELLDQESRAALETLAGLLSETLEKEPDARFVVEGHTSTDGPADGNLRLSAARAKRVYDELTQRYEVPRSLVDARGFGENYPNHPDGTKSETIRDARILLVRAE